MDDVHQAAQSLWQIRMIVKARRGLVKSKLIQSKSAYVDNFDLIVKTLFRARSWAIRHLGCGGQQKEEEK